jgi:ABC-type Mn2+/Zn2+ transport system permease subunit
VALIDLLLEPLSYGFMRLALITSITVGVVASVLSAIIVVRGWSLLGDAISHAVLPGVAVAVALNIPFIVGGMAAGLTAALLIGFVESRARVRNDTAIGIVLTGAFALGLVIISRVRPTVDIFHILFGNVLGVSPQSMMVSAAIGAAVLITLALFMKEVIAFTFDPVFSYVAGLPTTLIHYSLMAAMSLTIISALETVGIILIVSLLVTPGATAQLFARNMSEMIFLSTLVGVTSSIAGLYLSFYLAVSSGGTIALIVTLIFFTALTAKKLRKPTATAVTQPPQRKLSPKPSST